MAPPILGRKKLQHGKKTLHQYHKNSFKKDAQIVSISDNQGYKIHPFISGVVHSHPILFQLAFFFASQPASLHRHNALEILRELKYILCKRAKWGRECLGDGIFLYTAISEQMMVKTYFKMNDQMAIPL